ESHGEDSPKNEGLKLKPPGRERSCTSPRWLQKWQLGVRTESIGSAACSTPEICAPLRMSSPGNTRRSQCGVSRAAQHDWPAAQRRNRGRTSHALRVPATGFNENFV